VDEISQATEIFNSEKMTLLPQQYVFVNIARKQTKIVVETISIHNNMDCFHNHYFCRRNKWNRHHNYSFRFADAVLKKKVCLGNKVIV